MSDDPNDPARLEALYLERFGHVTPSRYVEDVVPADQHPTERSDTREHPDAFDPWTERLRALDAALHEHAADAVARRARTRHERDAADRAARTRRALDGS